MAQDKPKSVDTHRSPEQIIQSCRLCAEFLSVLCIAALAAIWAFNQRIQNQEITKEIAHYRFSEIGQKIARLRCYEERGPDFYEAISYMCAQMGANTWEFANIDRSRITARLSPLSGHVHGLSMRSLPIAREFTEAARRFGPLAADIMRRESTEATRRQQLNLSVETLSKNQEVQGFFNKVIIEKIIEYDTAPWDKICLWIDSGSIYLIYPYPTVEPEKRRVSYNHEEPADYDPEALINLVALQQAGTPAQAYLLLYEEWRNALDVIRSEVSEEPQIGVMGTGITLNASASMTVIALGLVAFQIIFFILWQERVGAISGDGPFDFPSFSAPRDPFSLPLPASLHGWMIRFAWTMFLITPVLIIFLGVATRYDFRSIDLENVVWRESSGEMYYGHEVLQRHWPSLNRENWERDVKSVGLDYFHLAAWGLSFLILIQITRSKEGASSRSLLRYIPASLIGVLAIVAFTWRWRSSQFPRLEPEPGFRYGYTEVTSIDYIFHLFIPAIALVLVVLIALSFGNRSRLGLVMGIACLSCWSFLTLR